MVTEMTIVTITTLAIINIADDNSSFSSDGGHNDLYITPEDRQKINSLIRKPSAVYCLFADSGVRFNQDFEVRLLWTLKSDYHGL